LRKTAEAVSKPPDDDGATKNDARQSDDEAEQESMF
jgi:hypothetical protein